MSTPAAAPQAQQQAPQDPELMQASFNATIEALVAQRDGALQSHAAVLSELRVTQVLLKRASDANEATKADLAAAQAEIARLNAVAADSAKTEQPTDEATAS